MQREVRDARGEKSFFLNYEPLTILTINKQFLEINFFYELLLGHKSCVQSLIDFFTFWKWVMDFFIGSLFYFYFLCVRERERDKDMCLLNFVAKYGF